MKIPKSIKGIPTVVLICILISAILAVYALASWTHYIKWDISATTTFDVFKDSGLTTPWLESDNSTGYEGYSETYWIKNTGNVKIRVTAQGTFMAGSGTQTWNPSSQYVDINVGSSASMNVTLTGLSVGKGSFRVIFTSAQAP